MLNTHGDIIPTTREICRNIINGVYSKRKAIYLRLMKSKNYGEHLGKVKNPADPFIVRGGYNCVINGVM